MIFSIQMNKGGVGKTSLVTNLAGVINQEYPDKKILIIDTDAQGNCSLAFGLKPKDFSKNVYHILTQKSEMKEVKISLKKNLDLIPANEEMDFFELDILTNIKQYKQPFLLLQKAIEKVKNEYDYIFIDTPPSLGLVAGNALAVADRVIIPFTPETFSVAGVVRVVDRLREFKEDLNPSLEISGVVGMMVDRRTSLHSEMLQEARKYCNTQNIRMYDTIIPRSIRFASATAYEGKPAVWTADRSNDIVAAYFELAKEVLENEC